MSGGIPLGRKILLDEYDRYRLNNRIWGNATSIMELMDLIKGENVFLNLYLRIPLIREDT